jgi:hypothetical protein
MEAWMRLSTIAGGKRRVVTLTDSGNFTVPPGVYSLEVYLQGAGGSGSAFRSIVGSTTRRGTAGGCGAFINGLVIDVDPGDIIPYACGAGGAAVTHDISVSDGSNGNDGGDTTFGTLTALGGHGGRQGSSTTSASFNPDFGDGVQYAKAVPASYGFASGGMSPGILCPRGKPGSGMYNTTVFPSSFVQGEPGDGDSKLSGGMGTVWGAGGDSVSATVSGDITATAGVGYGAGGGGVMAEASGALTGTATSGAGADGIIQIVYYGPEYA